MFLKFLILFKISLYLNFVFSFQDPLSLYTKYRAQTFKIFVENLRRRDICQGEVNEWIVMCQKTFQLLRNDNDNNNPYRNSLYMDYSVFQNDAIIKCNEKDIVYPGKSEVTKQNALNCYDRPLIPSSNSSITFTTQISIYYGLDDSMIVFKCIENICMVLEWFDKTKYIELLQLPSDLSIFRAPISSTNENDLYEIFVSVRNQTNYWCSPEFNIIGQMDRIQFEKVCALLYLRSEYEGRVNQITDNRTSSTLQKVRLKTSIVNILNITLPCPTLSCNKLYGPATSRKYLKLMPGLSEDSVILLLPFGISTYKPVEVISQLYEHNLLEVDKYF